MNQQLEQWMEEINQYILQVDVSHEGQHLWENYQTVVAIMLRVHEIRTQIAWLELSGEATPQYKKFRTTIIDPLIDRLHEVAAFESRKITAREIESKMER